MSLFCYRYEVFLCDFLVTKLISPCVSCDKPNSFSFTFQQESEILSTIVVQRSSIAYNYY